MLLNKTACACKEAGEKLKHWECCSVEECLTDKAYRHVRKDDHWDTHDGHQQ